MIFNKLKFIFERLFLSPKKAFVKHGGKVGNNTLFYTRDFGSEPYLIRIGNDCCITKGVRFFTHGGASVLRKEIPDFDVFGKIIVGDNVYIGANSLILPGVTIDNDVIVAAGSVVTKSIPSGWVVAGNPATKVSDIKTYREKNIQYNVSTKGLSPLEKKSVLLSLDDSKFISKKYLKET